MALDATVGGSSSNSYATRAQADAYFADRMYTSDWDMAAGQDKDKALIMATARLEQESFAGYRTSTTQALKFPRAGIYVDKVYMASDVIPAQVIAATCEYALEFITSDVTAQSELADFKRIKVGSVELEMNVPQSIQSGSIPSEILRLLRDFRVGSSGAAIVRA